jgi:hypothetical protein
MQTYNDTLVIETPDLQMYERITVLAPPDMETDYPIKLLTDQQLPHEILEFPEAPEA